MENRSHALLTGFFTLSLLVAAILAGLWFNRDRVERVPYEIATTLSIPGLNPQADVRYRGLEVGRVDEIVFDSAKTGQILIRMSIDKAAPVTHSTFASLGYQGVTGIAFIQLDDEKTGSPRAVSNDDRVVRIPLRPGFLDQLEKRGMVILKNAEEMTERLNNLVAPDNQKLVLGAVDKIGKAAEAFEALPAKLDPTLARLPQLADQAEQSMKSFNELSASANKAVRNYDQLATTLQAPDGPISRLNNTVERVGGSLEAVTSDLELQTLPNFVSMTNEAKTSLRAVRRTANTFSDRPQSILFGAPNGTPGPGEPGFVAPTK